MKNVPQVIYLNCGDDSHDIKEVDDFRDLHEVTWSEEIVNDTDLKYYSEDYVIRLINQFWRLQETDDLLKEAFTGIKNAE